MPKGVIFSTLTEMLSPRLDEFIFVCLNNSLDFAQSLGIQPVGYCQRDNRFQPELRLAVFARYMDVDSWLLIREEVEPASLLPEDRWAHAVSLHDGSEDSNRLWPAATT